MKKQTVKQLQDALNQREGLKEAQDSLRKFEEMMELVKKYPIKSDIRWSNPWLEWETGTGQSVPYSHLEQLGGAINGKRVPYILENLL